MISALVRRGDEAGENTPMEGQNCEDLGEDCHLRAKKTGLRRNQICWPTDLGLLPSRTVRKLVSVFSVVFCYGNPSELIYTQVLSILILKVIALSKMVAGRKKKGREIFFKMTLLLFSRPIMSSSLQPHGLQDARPPCPSPSPEVCPSSCPLHRWCPPAISSCDTLFSFCPQCFPASGAFSMSWLFTSGDKNTGASSISPSDEYSGLISFNIDCLVSLQSKGLSGVFSSTTVQRHQFFGTLLYSPALTSVHEHWEDHSLDYTGLRR